MTFDSVSLSNIFLACISLINLVILAMMYQVYKKNNQ
jgi:high-affinity nickel permease